MNRESWENAGYVLKAERCLNKLILLPHTTLLSLGSYLIWWKMLSIVIQPWSLPLHLSHLGRQLCFKSRLSWVEQFELTTLVFWISYLPPPPNYTLQLLLYSEYHTSPLYTHSRVWEIVHFNQFSLFNPWVLSLIPSKSSLYFSDRVGW